MCRALEPFAGKRAGRRTSRRREWTTGTMRDEMWVLLLQDCHVPPPILDRESVHACRALQLSNPAPYETACVSYMYFAGRGATVSLFVLPCAARRLFLPAAPLMDKVAVSVENETERSWGWILDRVSKLLVASMGVAK